jgi:hypothetical protein
MEERRKSLAACLTTLAVNGCRICTLPSPWSRLPLRDGATVDSFLSFLPSQLSIDVYIPPTTSEMSLAQTKGITINFVSKRPSRWLVFDIERQCLVLRKEASIGKTLRSAPTIQGCTKESHDHSFTTLYLDRPTREEDAINVLKDNCYVCHEKRSDGTYIFITPDGDRKLLKIVKHNSEEPSQPAATPIGVVVENTTHSHIIQDHLRRIITVAEEQMSEKVPLQKECMRNQIMEDLESLVQLLRGPQTPISDIMMNSLTSK